MTFEHYPALDAALLANPGAVRDYMNKQHWISIRLDGHLPQEEMLQLCRRSYQLIFSKLPQKLQKEITG